jgi:hypothetical protein
MTDHDLIFYGDAFADKSVRRNLAITPDDTVILNFDEWTYLRIITDPAAVDIDQIG